MLIGGEWVDAKEDQPIAVEDPATGEIFEHVPRASESDLDAAVRAAHRAFPHWAALSPEVRADLPLRAAALVRARAEEIARLMTMEQGKPLRWVFHLRGSLSPACVSLQDRSELRQAACANTPRALEIKAKYVTP